MSQPLGRWPLPYLPLLTILGYLPCVLTGLRLPGIAGDAALISIMTAHWAAAHCHLTLYASLAEPVPSHCPAPIPTSLQALDNNWPISLSRTLDPTGAGLWYFTYPPTALHLIGQGLCGGCNPLSSSSRLASLLALSNSFPNSSMLPG